VVRQRPGNSGPRSASQSPSVYLSSTDLSHSGRDRQRTRPPIHSRNDGIQTHGSLVGRLGGHPANVCEKASPPHIL